MFYGKRIGVHFTLLGPAPIQGDVDNKIAQVSIGDAKDRLVEAFTDGIFQVYFMPDPVSVSLYHRHIITISYYMPMVYMLIYLKGR